MCFFFLTHENGITLKYTLRILGLSMAGVGPDTFTGVRALKTLCVVFQN